jgi:hypothetical protein
MNRSRRMFINNPGDKMNRKLLLLMLVFTKSLLAVGPTIDCRFAALNKEASFDFDEAVTYKLNPVMGINGNFDPYEIDISVYETDLAINIYLDGEPLSEVLVPITNIASLPIGASIFGINTVFHESESGYISIRYECKRAIP